MKKRIRPQLLLALIAVLACIIGMRSMDADESLPHDFPADAAALAPEDTYEKRMPQQVAVKLENADAPTDTEPSPEEIPEDSQVTEPTIEETYGEAARYMAKAMYGEANICSTVERAGAGWNILNRVDSTDPYYPDDIIGVVIQPGQYHGYKDEHPVLPELYELALDVIGRWEREKNGEADVGRVLPTDYLFFTGDGEHNYFRTEWRSGASWDWSLPNPYEE